MDVDYFVALSKPIIWPKSKTLPKSRNLLKPEIWSRPTIQPKLNIWRKPWIFLVNS